MDNTASEAEFIATQAIAAADTLNKAANAADSGVLFAPQSFHLHDLEKFQLGRRRFRGAFASSVIDDFVSYVKDEAADRVGVRGFIDPDKFTAKVFFNLHEVDEPAGHADFTGSLALKPTAPYAAALAIDGKAGTQRTLLDFLEDWQPHVTAFDEAGNPMGFAQLIAAIREVKIRAKREGTHVEEDRRAARSAMEEVEADMKGAWPARIYFRCEPYVGLPPVELPFRVGLLTDTEDPRLVLRCIGKEALLEGVVQSFKAVLNEKLQGAELALLVGAFAP